MKILKNYFLFFAQHPVLYNSILMGLALIASFILEHLQIRPMSGYDLGIEMSVFFAHTMLIYLVISIYITRQDVDLMEDNSYLFQVAVFPDGRKKVLSKPIWGKSVVYNIARAYEYSLAASRFIVSTSCGGKYENSQIAIPVKLDFKLNGHFNEIELFNELFKDHGGPTASTLSLDKYVRNVFNKVNIKSQDLIDAAIKKYALQQSTEPVLLNEVITAINFPERLFTNFTNVKICLESPSFSSCKGTSCGED